MNDNFNTRMILTTAVFAAVAALLVGPASAYVMDVEGGGGSGTPVATQPTVQPGTIPYLSHGVGVDQSQFSGTVDELDPAIRTAIAADVSPSSASTVGRSSRATSCSCSSRPAFSPARSAPCSVPERKRSDQRNGAVPPDPPRFVPVCSDGRYGSATRSRFRAER